MYNSTTKIAIISYPGCMQSAVFGLKEQFILASNLCQQNGMKQRFNVKIIELHELNLIKHSTKLQILIIPPNVEGKYYLKPDKFLTDWINKQHIQGCIVCSICAGAFILAATDLLENNEVTTHWILASEFKQNYPLIKLNTNKILINNSDIISAGGLMSWIDLGLELVAQFSNANIMRQLGKLMVVDTGLREQQYYKSFTPKLNHGDETIIKAQHFMQTNFIQTISTKQLAALCFLGDRTFLRRFFKATAITPIQYLQKLRIQKACEILETSNQTIESIAYQVGYQDSSAFRKIFIKTTGLTPKAFKNRFYKYQKPYYLESN